MQERSPWATLPLVLRVIQTQAFRDWLTGLRDRSGRARILVRVTRLAAGNPGDSRNLTGGLSELRVDIGPGYRVYYTIRGQDLVLLLLGGDKSSQDTDIVRAAQLLREYEDEEVTK